MKRLVRDSWQVVECSPRDFFDDCTLTVEQWLAKPLDEHTDYPTVSARWEVLMHACVLAFPHVMGSDGLRQPPRVAYDPVGDQLFFIFKASNNGTTYLVSSAPIRIDD